MRIRISSDEYNDVNVLHDCIEIIMETRRNIVHENEDSTSKLMAWLITSNNYLQ